MMGLAVRRPAGSIRWATTPVVIDGPAKSTYKPGKIITLRHANLSTERRHPQRRRAARRVHSHQG
jgi:hypothetical protein